MELELEQSQCTLEINGIEEELESQATEIEISIMILHVVKPLSWNRYHNLMHARAVGTD